jgi:hypothetical protein
MDHRSSFGMGAAARPVGQAARRLICDAASGVLRAHSCVPRRDSSRRLVFGHLRWLSIFPVCAVTVSLAANLAIVVSLRLFIVRERMLQLPLRSCRHRPQLSQ